MRSALRVLAAVLGLSALAAANSASILLTDPETGPAWLVAGFIAPLGGFIAGYLLGAYGPPRPHDTS